MSVLKPRQVYVLSLAVLGCVVAAVFLLVRQNGPELPRERQVQLIKTGSGWVLQVDLVNHGGTGEFYRVVTAYRGAVRDSQGINLEPGRKFRYTHYFPASKLAPGGKEKLYVAVYKGSNPAPVAQNDFFLE